MTKPLRTMKKYAIISTEKGVMKAELYTAETPGTAANFIDLAEHGFYDGLTFHRVIPDFVIQGGCPRGDGTGGPGYTIPAEFNQGLVHKKGALAAARRGDAANPKKESSGSQFYIVQDEVNCRHLDGEYTVFGETVEGFDVIDKIASVQTDRRDRPVEDIHIKEIKPVISEESAEKL